jgi:hypothetical protein
MRRSYLLNLITLAALLLFAAVTTSAQTDQLRGTVKIVGADGQQTAVAGAAVDVYRTDMKADYHTKSDKKGDWIFAGLPLVGTYTVTISAPGASPMTKAGVKARRDIPVDAVLAPGDGKKLTEAEALAASKGQATTTNGGGDTSAADKAAAAEIAKKNAEISKENSKIENANKVIAESFKAGNTALLAGNEADRANKHDEAMKLYGDAIQQYDTGVAADPEHPGIASLLTNKSAALRSRAVDKYNAAIQSKDEAARTAGIEAAKVDFSAAAEAANRAVELIKKIPAATDAAEQKQQTLNKYFALNARAESMRLFVIKVDSTKASDATGAYEEYAAVETDPVKKLKAEKDFAQMLFETAGDQAGYERAIAEYNKILEKAPDDPDSLLRIGQAMFNIGALNNNDKAKYQEASNYLQRYVDKAPDSQLRTEAKELIETMKQQANVTPEKKAAPQRGKRP